MRLVFYKGVTSDEDITFFLIHQNDYLTFFLNVHTKIVNKVESIFSRIRLKKLIRNQGNKSAQYCDSINLSKQTVSFPGGLEQLGIVHVTFYHDVFSNLYIQIATTLDCDLKGT